MEERNYFANSNWWLGVLVVFLMVFTTIASILFVGNINTNLSDSVTGYVLAIVVGCMIIAGVAVVSALAARKEAYELSKPENISEMINSYLTKLIDEGKLELLKAFLYHQDELEFCVRLDEQERGRAAFVEFLRPRFSEDFLNSMWFLATSLGNLPIIKEIVESNLISNFNVRDKEGDTAAHVAVMFGQDHVLDYFKTLHEKGLMNLGLRNGDGKTPFDLLNQIQKKMVELLSGIQSDPIDSVGKGDVVERESEGEVTIEHTDAAGAPILPREEFESGDARKEAGDQEQNKD